MLILPIKFKLMIPVEQSVECKVRRCKNDEEQNSLSNVKITNDFVISKQFTCYYQRELCNYETQYTKSEKPLVKYSNLEFVFPVVIANPCNITSIIFDELCCI